MLNVYLAGGMKSGWQESVKISCDPHYFNFFDPRLNGSDVPCEFSTWDELAIKRSDVVFAYLEKDNPGGFALGYELGLAKRGGATTIFIMEMDDPRWRGFAMIREGVDICYYSLLEGIEFLKKLR